MTGRQREILQRVASGELSPEEADRLLGSDESTGEDAHSDPIRRVKISVGVGGIDVVGDATVAQAEVDGLHRAEVKGDTLVIHGERDADAEGFSFKVGRHRRGLFGGPHRDWDRHAARLRIRMNPSLDLDVELDAGPLTITNMTGPIRARLSVGPITIERFTGPLDVAVNAGAVRAIGMITEGESRIRSDAGAVRVELDPGSDVHVIAHAALGKVVVPGSDERRQRFGGDRREATIGGGRATLRVETAMGSVHVSA